jgi:hypothetical protein
MFSVLSSYSDEKLFFFVLTLGCENVSKLDELRTNSTTLSSFVSPPGDSGQGKAAGIGFDKSWNPLSAPRRTRFPPSKALFDLVQRQKTHCWFALFLLTNQREVG